MTSTPKRPVRARTVLQALMVALPWAIRRRLCTTILRWHLDPTSRIGWSIVDADTVVLGEGARIGHATVIRDLRRLELGLGSSIGNWNWITAARALRDRCPDGAVLRIGAESAITSRHYIDCSGGVEIGKLVTVAGVGSTFMTHQIDRTSGTQSVSAIAIGDRSLISSDVRFTPGATVARDSVVGMGAVVVGELDEPERLYVGVPARAVKTLSANDAYLRRSHAYVGAGTFTKRTHGSREDA